mmetsp:Transcript_81/g.110  ORF Transcript_81/g.110 Transcript_81/m.110 type:complete len:186 (+) Transcript_81:84-641(+)
MSSSSSEERKEGDRKRTSSEIEGTGSLNISPTNRPRLVYKDIKSDQKNSGAGGKNGDRWRPHGVTEDYVNVVGEIMYPKQKLGPYGYDAEKGRFPIDRVNTLGWLLCPLRKPTVVEKWSPFEVSVFEGAITLYGKNFHMIHKFVKTKTVREVIEFYYDWKKTSHYKEWKKNYVADDRETPCVYAD